MGTITVRAATLNALIYDVAKSLIHHGFNRLVFVNGHTSNVKVVDPVMRKLRYETGALIAMYKPYGERYLGLVEDILENPPEETPGWHASEQETSIMMAYDESNVRMTPCAQLPRKATRSSIASRGISRRLSTSFGQFPWRSK